MMTLLLFVVLIVVGKAMAAASLWLPAKLKPEHRPSFWKCLGVTLLMDVLSLGAGFLIDKVVVKSQAEAYGLIAFSFAVTLAIVAICIHSVLKVRGRVFWATFGTFLVVALVGGLGLALGIKAYVAEGFVVPTSTMSPTIVEQERFVANKLIRPQRWDVVVFYPPDRDPAQRMRYVKRLIALPGEKLVIKDGGIWINGQRQSPPESLRNIVYSSVAKRGYQRPMVAEGMEVVMGNDEYFVIGDNVTNSMDSRYFGPVKNDAMIGVGEFTYWPVSSWKLLR